MTLSAEQLAQRVGTLPAPDGELSPVFRMGLAPAGGLSMHRLDEPTLGRWVDDEIARVEGGDRKLGAAYLIGRLAWSLAHGLAGLALVGAWASSLRPSAVSFSRRPVRWEHEGESGVVGIVDTWLDPVAADFTDASDADAVDRFRAAVEALMAPIVEALHIDSGLARSALWRLVGDSLSASFLAQGKALGCAEHAMALALPMLRHKGGPLYSKQTGFIEVAIPEQPQVSDWFRARGGCCRYYTAEGGEYCTTCVLRDAESRDMRLIDHLRRTHAAEGA